MQFWWIYKWKIIFICKPGTYWYDNGAPFSYLLQDEDTSNDDKKKIDEEKE